jgi:hypothetical protein
MVNGIPNLATRQGQLARALERDGAFHLCASHLVEQLFKPIDLLLGALVRSRASPFGPQRSPSSCMKGKIKRRSLSLARSAANAHRELPNGHRRPWPVPDQGPPSFGPRAQASATGTRLVPSGHSPRLEAISISLILDNGGQGKLTTCHRRDAGFSPSSWRPP